MHQVTERIRDVSTAESPGKGPHQPSPRPPVVYFDEACTLCKILADFMGRRVGSDRMIFRPHPLPQQEKLSVEFDVNGQLLRLSGESAWAWILEHHPSLHEFNWVAQKLGMARGTARTLMATGDLLRRFCWRCP